MMDEVSPLTMGSAARRDLALKDAREVLRSQRLATLWNSPGAWTDFHLDRYLWNCEEVEQQPVKTHCVLLSLNQFVAHNSREDRWYEMRPGVLATYSAGYEATWAYKGPGDAFHLNISPTFVDELASEVSGKRVEVGVEYGPDVDDPEIKRAIKALGVEAQDGFPCGRLFAEAAVRAIAIRLYARSERASLPDRKVEGLSYRALRRTIQFIHDRMGEDLCAAEIAREAGYSPFHFQRLFKHSTGQPLHAFVIRARVEKAASLLRLGLPVQNVAASVGFTDSSHLARHVRSRYGVSPGALARGARA